jgi:GNAT superfamily N-acetyltransferase
VTYEIMRYDPEMMPQLARLQKHLLGPSARRNGRYLEWKYEQNPYLPQPVIYVGLHAGRVVAMRGLFGAQWQMGRTGICEVLPYVDDGVVHPAHRDRGLIKRIMQLAFREMAEEGFSHLINLSAGPTSFFMFLEDGWRSVAHMGVAKHSGSDGAATALSRARSSLRDSVRAAARRVPIVRRLALERAWSRHFGGTADGCVVRDTPRPGAMAQLSQTLSSDRFGHVRGPEFFRWRFRNPYRQYHFVFSEREGRLDGYLVLKTPLGALPDEAVGSIVDWAADTRETEERLFRAALRYPCTSVDVWTATLKEGTRAMLTKLGFEPVRAVGARRFVPALLIRALQDSENPWQLGGRDLRDPASWNVRLIDSMHG